MKKRIKLGKFTTLNGEQVHIYTRKGAGREEACRASESISDYYKHAKINDRILRDIVRCIDSGIITVPWALHEQMIELGVLQGWLK